jgi:transcriptional regulator with XRE-family HTH domain
MPTLVATIETMSDGTAHPNELGAFLNARRAELSPGEVGLRDVGGHRRVAGLRREEVAQLAAISTDYYTRLEQGRIRASASVLASLARVLRLDDDQRTYLYELAGRNPSRPRRRATQKVRPQMQLLLDQLSEIPAMILGRNMDILAWNSLAAALITDFSQIPEDQRNHVRLVFTDPAIRHLYADWEGVARSNVAMLRMDAAENPDDPRLAALVGELSVQEPQFRQWWAAQQVASRGFGRKVFRHPVAGEIVLDWDTLVCATDPEQKLIIMTAEPGSPSQEALRFLASWSASPASQR